MDENIDYKQCAILYVDDEPQALKYFSKLLGDDFRTLTAQSAADARRLLETEPDIGILFTDQRMPGETGVNLLEYARAHFPNIVRIITTAYSDLQSAIDSVNSGGVFQYVAKPWKLDELRGVFKRAIDFYSVREQRDDLLAQKLGVLQGVLILDRVRAFAAVAAFLEDRLRRPQRALKSYVEHARAAESGAFDRADVFSLDLWKLAEDEGEFLVKAVRNLHASLPRKTGEDIHIETDELVHEISRGISARQKPDGVKLVYAPDGKRQIVCRPDYVRRLVTLLIDRVVNMDGEDIVIDVRCTPAPDTDEQVVIEVAPRGRSWSPQQLACLYSAVIPRKNWLMGIDMDLLPAYLVAHDQGGDISVDTSTDKSCIRARVGQLAAGQPDISAEWLSDLRRHADEVLAVPSAD